MSDIHENPSRFVGPSPFVVKPDATEALSRIAALDHITSSIGNSRVIDRSFLESTEDRRLVAFQDEQTWGFALTPHLLVVSDSQGVTSVRRMPLLGVFIPREMTRDEYLLGGKPFTEIPQWAMQDAVKATDQLVADAKRYASYQLMSDNLLRVLELGYVDIKPGHAVKGAESDGEERWLLLSEKQEAKRMDELIRLTRKLPEPLRNAQIIKISNGLGVNMQAKIDELNRQEAHAHSLSY